MAYATAKLESNADTHILVSDLSEICLRQKFTNEDWSIPFTETHNYSTCWKYCTKHSS